MNLINKLLLLIVLKSLSLQVLSSDPYSCYRPYNPLCPSGEFVYNQLVPTPPCVPTFSLPTNLPIKHWCNGPSCDTGTVMFNCEKVRILVSCPRRFTQTCENYVADCNNEPNAHIDLNDIQPNARLKGLVPVRTKSDIKLVAVFEINIKINFFYYRYCCCRIDCPNWFKSTIHFDAFKLPILSARELSYLLGGPIGELFFIYNLIRKVWLINTILKDCISCKEVFYKIIKERHCVPIVEPVLLYTCIRSCVHKISTYSLFAYGSPDREMIYDSNHNQLRSV